MKIVVKVSYQEALLEAASICLSSPRKSIALATRAAILDILSILKDTAVDVNKEREFEINKDI